MFIQIEKKTAEMLVFFCLQTERLLVRNEKEGDDSKWRFMTVVKLNAVRSSHPLAFEMTSEKFKDQFRTAKPILDEYQTEEFDLRIPTQQNTIMQ